MKTRIYFKNSYNSFYFIGWLLFICFKHRGNRDGKNRSQIRRARSQSRNRVIQNGGGAQRNGNQRLNLNQRTQHRGRSRTRRPGQNDTGKQKEQLDRELEHYMSHGGSN